MLLLQVYPILIATAASINTKNLSLFDAHFAVAVSASPVSVFGLFCGSGRVEQAKHAIPKADLRKDLYSLPRTRPSSSLARNQFNDILLPQSISK